MELVNSAVSDLYGATSAILMWTSLALLVVGLLVRLSHHRAASGNDEWVVEYHIARFLQCRKRGLTLDRIPNSIRSSSDGYPSLLYLLISILPSQHRRAGLLALQTVPDFVLALAVFGLVHLVFRVDLVASFAISVLLLFSTLLVPFTSRLTSFSGRPFALMLSFFFGLSLDRLSKALDVESQAGLNFGAFAALVLVASALFCIGFLTSMFGTQVNLLLVLAASLTSKNVVPLLVLAAVLVFFWFAPLPFLRAVARHHVYFKRWYWTNVGSNTSATGRLVLGLAGLGSRQLFIRLRFLATRQNPLIIAVEGAGLVFVAMFAISGTDFTFFQWTVFLLFLAFLATTIGKMKSLGQAERYLEFALPFAALHVGRTIADLNNLDEVLQVVVVWQLIFLPVHFIKRDRSKTPTVSASSNYAVLEAISEVSTSARILVNPVKLSYKFIGPIWKEERLSGLELYFRYALHNGSENYDYFSLDISSPFANSNEAVVQRCPWAMKEDYGINFFVLEHFWKEHLSNIPCWQDLFTETRPILTESQYAVFRLKSESTHDCCN